MTTWHMRIACWISKATNTHTEYIIINVFPLQCLHEAASVLRYTYVVYVVKPFLCSANIIPPEQNFCYSDSVLNSCNTHATI
jgi:hypothetical protein